MASDLQNILQRITNKSEVLLERHRALMEEKDKLSEANAELTARNQSLQKEVEQLRRENEYLRLARNIASTPEQVEQNKARISKLVRDIDKCISQLTD